MYGGSGILAVYKRQEFGGDDQWSNMLGGTELIRRKLGKDAYAMTVTLLTDSQGKKDVYKRQGQT